MEHLRISGARYPGVPHNSGERGLRLMGCQPALCQVSVLDPDPAEQLKYLLRLLVAFLGKPDFWIDFKVLPNCITCLPNPLAKPT